jgi:hypothetical protein
LLLRVGLLMLGTGNPQSPSQLLEIHPALLTAHRTFEQLAEIIRHFPAIPETAIWSQTTQRL